jgi:hypothetical protein
MGLQQGAAERTGARDKNARGNTDLKGHLGIPSRLHTFLIAVAHNPCNGWGHESEKNAEKEREKGDTKTSPGEHSQRQQLTRSLEAAERGMEK